MVTMAFLASCGCAILYVLLLLLPFDVTASSASVSRVASRSEDSWLKLHGLKPNQFVMAAPLVVAAVCKDGVAIVATHTASSKEPLLMDETFVENAVDNFIAEDSVMSNSSDSTQNAPLPLDLPLSFRGPFRIQTIDGFGTTLACAGWRTDGEMLASKCRSLAAFELDRFGEPTNGFEYGRFLAEEASSWMAQCAVSDDVRALSCVGLLSTYGGGEGDGCLWLVDATGAYRVRAHAIGWGAKTVNERLRRIDCSVLTREQCALRLLQTIVEKPDEKEKTAWKLPSNAYAEVAVVASSQRKMSRLWKTNLVSPSNDKK